jgi:hypothetical protein
MSIRVGATLCFLVLACSGTRLIPNTKVPDSPENQEIIGVCERYRHALIARDQVTLMALASPHYFEDSGTPKSDDDYGYDGLRQVIQDRLARLKSVRYDMEYRDVHIEGNRAQVDVYIDASFQLTTGGGDQYRHFTEYNRLELEHDGKRWLFTRGM